MPRQIIDTEASRPAYERRRRRGILAATFILIAAAAVAWVLLRAVVKA